MDRPRTGHGFTLLEVLVAMAILGLGMIAVFSGMNQSLNVTERLRDKTLANWVALNQITELQVTGEYPDAGTRSDQVEMANSEWVYEMKISNIPQINMRRPDITVSFADSPNDILAAVIGFIGPAAAAGTTAKTTDGSTDGEGQEAAARQDGGYLGFGKGWEPPRENFGVTE